AERSRLLGHPCRAGRREPADEGELARRTGAPVVLGAAVADVHDLALERLHGGREGMGQPLDDGTVWQAQAALEGQADVGLDLTAFHLDAEGLERPLDVVEGLRLARAARLPLPG